MTPDTDDDPTKLVLERTLNASPKEVFDAWTKADLLEKWFAPTDDFSVKVTDLEVREGGHYRVEMIEKGGEVHPVHGQYRTIEPPHRLVMTWGWEAEDLPDSLVTIELAETDDGRTLLTLTHEKFPTAEIQEQSLAGWQGCVARLERVFA